MTLALHGDIMQDIMEEKIIYYKDELKDEFSEAEIQAKVIDGTYNYEGGRWGKGWHILWYKIIARPLAYVFLKIHFRHKIIGKEKISQKDGGYFLYGNHTNAMADALIPSMISYPKDMYVIVHPNNVSMPVLGRITPFLGALPLPGDMHAARNFSKALKSKIEQGSPIGIYPEAHIWPYYTKIRPFTEVSFGYPQQMDVPVYCFTNTYQKRKKSKTPQIVTYVDGPFYVNQSLSKKEQKLQLRSQVYETMRERSKNNNVEIIHYVRETDE